MRDSKKIPIKDMPFYSSMERVQSNTKLDTGTLLQFQIGFKAGPSSCECGHEWSAFDLMEEAIGHKQHGWEFYKNPELTQTPDAFFRGTEDIKCPKCGKLSTNVVFTYHYGGYIYPKPPET